MNEACDALLSYSGEYAFFWGFIAGCLVLFSFFVLIALVRDPLHPRSDE